MQPIIVAPSVLSADFSNLSAAIEPIQQSSAEWIHLDVMDGKFVPNVTFGAKMVSDLRPLTRLTFDVHLMVEQPEPLIEDFVTAGADLITVHWETTPHLHRVLTKIRHLGAKAGVSIVPATPVHFLREVFSLVDLVLVMTVNPGFGGQSIIPGCLEKVSELRSVKLENDYRFLVEVDGGINLETASSVREAGAEVLVVGTAFFGSENPARLVEALRGGAQ